MTRSAAARFGVHDAGQSLVELALAVPLLLVTLLGLVDIGRAYVYTTAVANAAREAALYAAKDATVTDTEAAQRAWDESGFGDWGGAAASNFTVTCTGCGSAATDVTVSVAYQFDLVSGYLFQRILGVDHFIARGTATFRSLSQ